MAGPFPEKLQDASERRLLGFVGDRLFRCGPYDRRSLFLASGQRCQSFGQLANGKDHVCDPCRDHRTWYAIVSRLARVLHQHDAA